MSLYFETCGMLTSIQDEGRFGFQKLGVSPAGPMDARAFHLANLLVGNGREAAALEITCIGPGIRVEADCVIALTGADMSPVLDGVPIPMYQAVPVRAGQRLTFGALKYGSRGYIALGGGLDIPPVMGSRATLMRNHLGGLEGRAVKAGDRIPLLSPAPCLPDMESRRLPVERYPKPDFFVRVIRGPQDDRFTARGMRTFLQSAYTITKEADRMGCRLEGPAVEHTTDANIMTDGLAVGSIQIPGNGQPIIMLADRQSTGGYTKIATVITVDLPLLAQAKPGDRISFVEVGVDLAQTLLIRQHEELEALEEQWSTHSREGARVCSA